MAKAQMKKGTVQAEQTVFALDIGTRSIIGMVGIVQDGKVKILAIEKEEHAERAMIDGQIENIEKVAALADKVKKRLENLLDIQLSRVCVAAAGRALRTRRAEFELELPQTQTIDDEVISRLEAGAISRAEEAFNEEKEAQGDSRRFYLAGYTVCQYYLDQYGMMSLKDHRGRKVKVDLIATFLPSEVVESLYTTMNKIGLEVASITLEPIAAINAAIPENLRLLNLVMVDIGAGTSDIAACTGGSVAGYTMATVAGDEVTEAVMKKYLVDFGTAEKIKAQMDQEKEIVFSDILGFEHKVTREDVFQAIESVSEVLCKEISEKILEVNGGPPSALFLAGGGSKLAGLKDGLASVLKMDANRVAIAGSYFQASAFSDEYDLNNPEYATPLGIAVSAGLNMINDSFRVVLNGKPAKLFRSGSFTALNLLMMNGYGFRDIMGRPGGNITITVNGQRRVFYGTAAEPASLVINGKEGKLSQIIRAGDSIDFVPAKAGIPAEAYLGDLEGAATCKELRLNGEYAFLETPLKSGDVIVMGMADEKEPEKEEKAEISRQTANRSMSGRHVSVPVEREAAEAAQRETELMRREEAEAAQKEPEPEKREEVEAAQKPLEPERWEKVEAAQKEPEPERREKVEAAQKEPEPVRREEVEAAQKEPEPVRQEEAGAAQKPTEPVKREEAGAAQREPEPERREKIEAAQREAEPVKRQEAGVAQGESEPVRRKAEKSRLARKLHFYLNDLPLYLPGKEDGSPYYLMDMIEYSGIDLKNPKGIVKLTVNGSPAMFQQALTEGDRIDIRVEKRTE